MTSTQRADRSLLRRLERVLPALARRADALHVRAVYERTSDTLEQAQLNKARALYDFAEMTPDKRVLDIGCGWGANLEYLCRARREARPRHHAVDARSTTRSTRRSSPGVQVTCTDYKDFAPDREVRRAAVDRDDRPPVLAGAGAQGLAIDIYRDYFKHCASWVKPGACFGFQAILRNRVPRNRAGPRGPAVHRRRDLPRRPQPAARRARRRRQPVLGDRRAEDPARALRQDHRRVAAPPAAATRRRSASSGATRSSTTTTATCRPACARSPTTGRATCR